MLRNFFAIFLVGLLFLASFVSATESTMIKVEEIKFCTGIENRQPVGVNTSFANTVERIYCYTKIVGASQPTSVAHIWFYNDEEIARVDLNVKSNNWRTWSSKKIQNSWTGKWRVDVVSSEGDLLASKEFTVAASLGQFFLTANSFYYY